MRMQDIPTLESAGRLGRRPDSDSPLRQVYTAERVREPSPLGSAALSVAFRSARFIRDRVFPSASDMSSMQISAAVSYTMHASCYNNYNGPCDSPCYGFAEHQMLPFYCATCDEQDADPANNPAWNWHYVGTRFNGGIEYGDLSYNICQGRDAWKWKVEGHCGDCESSAVFRCHDGYKCYESDGSVDNTICVGSVACDGDLTLC